MLSVNVWIYFSIGSDPFFLFTGTYNSNFHSCIFHLRANARTRSCASIARYHTHTSVAPLGHNNDNTISARCLIVATRIANHHPFHNRSLPLRSGAYRDIVSKHYYTTILSVAVFWFKLLPAISLDLVLATMQHLLTAIRARVRFIDGQVRIGRDRAEVIQAQSDALTSMFATASPTLDEVTTLTDELAAGPWTHEQIVTMSTRLAAAVTNPTHSGARKLQSMKSPEFIFTETDYASMSDPDKSLNIKALTAAKRLHRCGVSCPSAALVKQVAAILRLLHYGDSPLAADKRQAICMKVRDAIKELDAGARSHLPHILVFPARPSDLPADRYDSTYGTGDSHEPPVADVTAYLDVDMLPHVVKDMVYRNTHRELRAVTNAASPSQITPSTQLQPEQHDMQQQPMMQMMQMMTQMMQTFAGGGGNERAQQRPDTILSGFKPRVTHRICDDDAANEPDQRPAMPTTPRATSSAHGDAAQLVTAVVPDASPRPSVPAPSPGTPASCKRPSPSPSRSHVGDDEAACSVIADLEQGMRACTNHQKAQTTQRAKAQRAQKAADKLAEIAQLSTASARDVQAASKAVEKARAATATSTATDSIAPTRRRLRTKEAAASPPSAALPEGVTKAVQMAAYRTESRSQ